MHCVGLENAHWHQAKELLQRAIDLNGGKFDLDDIKQRIDEQKMQLWGIHDGELKAAMVTEVVNYPQKRCLRVVLIGGFGIDDWEPMVARTLDGYGKAQGASAVEIWGRRGWVRQLAKYGYREYETVVLKELA